MFSVQIVFEKDVIMITAGAVLGWGNFWRGRTPAATDCMWTVLGTVRSLMIAGAESRRPQHVETC